MYASMWVKIFSHGFDLFNNVCVSASIVVRQNLIILCVGPYILLINQKIKNTYIELN